MTSGTTARAPPTSTLPAQEAEEEAASSLRYLAYLSRVRSLFGASRYLAYTSDVGEAFRPVLRPALVRAAYITSFAYVGGDVVQHGLHARQTGEPWWPGTVRGMGERALFQGLASLAVPAVTIHTVVHTVQRVMKRMSADFMKHRVLRWGPSAAGLAVIPLLPLVDEPIEHGVERLFSRVWPHKTKAE